jgi:hypothetical protein
MATIWVKRDDWMTVAQAKVSVVTRELEAVDWTAWQRSYYLISSDLLLYMIDQCA